MSDFENRFGGIARLYGDAALETIKNAHVCVIGIGGVGSWAAEALARSGFGEITLIDLDDICTTNTNRQIHANSKSVGNSKVAEMAARIRAINPDCTVNELEDFATADTVRELLTTNMNYVIDAIDSAGSKAAIIAHCKRNKIPVITIGGAGGQIDPTQIQITDLARTKNDPLAAKVRSILRRHYNYSRNPKRHYSVPCVYSLEQPLFPTPEGGVCRSKTHLDGTRLDCAGGLGAATMVTASFGFIAVSKVIEKLTAKK